MKKFYTTLAMAAAIAFSASATVQLSNDFTKAASSLNSGAVNLSERITDYPVSGNAFGAPELKAPEGTWKEVSTGIWFEGLLGNRFSDIENTWSWDVKIEENEGNPGWYRLLPYSGSNPVASIIGQSDETNYMYICATNPDKVYMERFAAFGSTNFTFLSACPETGFSNQLYGTLVDGVITFPSGTLAYVSSGKYYLLNGEFKLVLNKETYKDYTMTFDVELCNADNAPIFELTTGADLDAVYMTELAGVYPMNAQNADVVVARGIDITQYKNKRVQYPFNGASAPGVHTFLVVGLDAAGNIKESTAQYAFNMADDDSNWGDSIKATYKEGILSQMFSDVDAEDLTVFVQEHKTKPGYFRIGEAYATHSMFGSNAVDHKEGHAHYMYIDATNPDQVYLEPSALGVSVGPSWGEACAYSWGYIYTLGGNQGQGVTDGVYGTFKDGKITIPKGNIMLSQKKYSKGSFLQLPSSDDFVVELPEDYAAIDGVVMDGDNTNAPVEYFNLQGVKVANPAEGGIYIRRQGSDVKKIYVK